MDDEQLQKVKFLYEHVVRIQQIDCDAYKMFLDKAERITTKHILILAGMAFAVSKLGWVHGWWWWPVGIIGISAGVTIAAAFGLTLYCMGPRFASVPDIRQLHDELLVTDNIDEIEHVRLIKDLAKSLAKSVVNNRKLEVKDSFNRKFFHYLTSIGFAFAVLFIGIVLIGDTFRETNMNNSPQEHPTNQIPSTPPTKVEPPPVMQPASTEAQPTVSVPRVVVSAYSEPERIVFSQGREKKK